MSTFPGPLPEIPNVSIDRFDGPNLKSTAFFLSHCHADHMVGLKSQELHFCLRHQDTVYVYCSEVSSLFLSYNHLNGLDYKIRTLPIGKAYTVNVPGVEKLVYVTALPAGHCPGSVMFLFEYDSKHILYTGDFRMTRKDIESLKGLRNNQGELVPIETLYIDSTFFHPVYAYLPTRDESMSELMKFCRPWIERGKTYVIDLRTPATYGVEYVLIRLFKEFGQPVHVSDEAYKKYCRLPELAPTITRNANSQFHACIAGHLLHGRKLFLKAHPTQKECLIKSVKLCSLHARCLEEGQSIISYSEAQSLYRLVYSSHSSHSELIEMVETLKPKSIVPCVVPAELTPEEVAEYLRPRNAACSGTESLKGDMSPLRFSSYETECASDSNEGSDTEADSKDETRNCPQHYDIRESSEEDLLGPERSGSGESGSQEFRWDCKYDSKIELAIWKNNRLSSEPPHKMRKTDE